MVKYVTAVFIALSFPMNLRWRPIRQDLRGIAFVILHRLLKIFFLSLFPSRGATVERWFFLSVISDMLLSTLRVANVHTVLNLHWQISLHRRIFNWKIWVEIFPVALLHSIASNVDFYFAAFAVLRLGFENHEVILLSQKISIYYVIFFLYGFTYFGAMVPMYAIFIRLAASMRPFPEHRHRARQSMERAWETMSPRDLRLFLKAFRIVFPLECAAMGWMMFFCRSYVPAQMHDQLGLMFVKYMA